MALRGLHGQEQSGTIWSSSSHTGPNLAIGRSHDRYRPIVEMETTALKAVLELSMGSPSRNAMQTCTQHPARHQPVHPLCSSPTEGGHTAQVASKGPTIGFAPCKRLSLQGANPTLNPGPFLHGRAKYLSGTGIARQRMQGKTHHGPHGQEGRLRKLVDAAPQPVEGDAAVTAEAVQHPVQAQRVM